MRKSIIKYLIICLISPCIIMAYSKEECLKSLNNFVSYEKRLIIAVLDFDVPQDINDSLKINPSQRIITMLVKSKKFDVVEREKIQKVLNEQKIGLSGLIDESTAVQVGKLVGANAVVFGVVSSMTQSPIDKFSYIDYETKANLDIRIVDCATGKILSAEKSEGIVHNKTVYSADGVLISGARQYPQAYNEAILKAVEEIIVKIAELFPPVGCVVLVKKKSVTIDIGQDSGVKSGQKYVIFRKGKEILHPVTKKSLGFDKEPLAIIRIEGAEQSMSVGVIDQIIREDNEEIEIKVGDFAILFKE